MVGYVITTRGLKQNLGNVVGVFFSRGRKTYIR